MADSAIDITAGTGTSVDTRTEASNGNHRQVIVLGDPSVNAGVAPVDGVLGLTVNFATRPTVAIVGNIPAAGGSLTVFQGGGAWLTTLATLPVVTNVTGYALESGGNLDSIITTLNSIKAKTDNLDVTLGSRLASGGTLPISGTINALNAGGSLTAFQGGTWTAQPGNTPNTIGWLITQATLPVVAGQGGTWTVQPGNTPNSTAWLITQATLPVVASITGTAALVSGTRVVGMAQYLPTLASMPDQGYVNEAVDLFGNLRVNTNVPLPNSTRFSRFLTFASYASIMAAPGSGKRLVIREMDFSGNATLTVELYEDHAGTPARVWGPHYFLPYSGFIKPTCYIPITANKSLGINITGSAFNSTLDIRIETENV